MRSRSFIAVLLAVVLGVPWLLSGTAPVALAASFTVTSLLDGHDTDLADGVCDAGGGQCTLRAAVEQANQLGGSHEITLGPGEHRIGTNAGAVTPQRIEVTADVTIVGAGRSETSVVLDSNTGSDMFRLLTNASLSISALTVTQSSTASWADGVVLSGNGSSLFVDDVLFLGLGDVPIAAWGYGSEPDPTGIDIWIEDSTIDGGSVGYSLLVVSSGGAEVDVVRTEIHSTTYALLVDNDLQAPVGDDVLRVTDSVLDGGFDPQIEENGIEAYGNFDVEVRGTTVRRHANAVYANSTSMAVIDSEIVDNRYIGVYLDGWDDTALVTIDGTLIAGNDQSALDVDGDMILRNSTLAGNATGGYTAFSFSDAALVENTTIVDNVESGIFLPVGSTLRNVTIARNGLGGTGDGVGLYVRGAVTMHNTVVAGNRFDCFTGPDQPDISGDHNADGDGGCGLEGPNDLTGVDPLLGPLAANGGRTPTAAPLPGSPLLDAGNDAECPSTDQRGAARPFDGDGDTIATCDIGAVEAGSEVLTSTSVTWSASSARRGMVAPDQPLSIQATSVAGGTAVAHVAVSSWYPGGDTTAPIAVSPASTLVDVPLTEGPAGVYTGTMPLLGVAEITAIDAVVSEGGQDRPGSAATGLPVRVAGAVEVTTALGVPSWALPISRAEVASGSTADGDSIVVPIDGVTQTRWLRPSADYELHVVDGQRRRVASASAPVEVRGGLVTQVTLDDVALPYLPFSLTVEDANGQPVAGIRATVTDQATGDQVVKVMTGPDGLVEGMARGAAIDVRLDPGTEPYLAADHPIVLTALGEQRAIALGAALPTAVVSGVVDHPQRPAVPGVRVSLTSQVGDRAFTTATTTGEDGRYRAVVFQGDVEVEVDDSRAGKASAATAVAADTTVDLLLTGPLIIDVAVDLRTRYAGEPVSTPVDLDGATGAHLQTTIDNGRRTIRVLDDVVPVPYYAGDTVRFCAHGYEADLPSGCADVAVDTATQTGAVSLVLEQAGAIGGALTWTAAPFLEDQEYRPDLRAHVFRIDGATRTKLDSVRPLLVTTPDPGELQLAEFFAPVFEPGEYEIRFELHEFVTVLCGFGNELVCGERWVHSEYTTVRATVPLDGIVDVGTLAFTVPGRRFTSSSGSGVTISPDVLLPDEIAQVRVSAHNSSEDTVDAAEVEIDLPGGTTVVPDSVTVAGQAGSSSVSDGVLTVPVGTIAPGETVVTTAWLEVGSGFDSDSLLVTGAVSYGATTEPLGSGVAIVRRLSINSVERTADLAVPVWGRSFPGSTVEVTVDGVVAGTAVATPGGFWSTVVSLPEVPLPKAFGLAAHSSGTAGTFSTPRHVVSYDESHPTLRRAVMQQSGGRVVEFDPRRGIAQFPYVFVPGQPILVDLEFDRPTAVFPPVVWIGSRSAEAEYDDGTGLWRATLRPQFSDLGEIRVAWEPVPVAVDLGPSVPQTPLTVEETRLMLPSGLRTFSDVTLVDPTPRAPVVSATFPDASETGETAEFAITVDDVEYQPTEVDAQIEALAGVPLWNLRMDERLQPDGDVDVSMSFVVPEYALNLDGGANLASFRPHPQQVSGTASLAFRLSFRLLDNLWKSATAAADLTGALNADEFTEKLAQRLGRVESKCAADRAAGFIAQLEALNRHYLEAVGVSVVLMLVGLLVGPETLGLGTLALFALTEAINRVVAAQLDQALAELDAAITAACDPEPDPYALNDDECELLRELLGPELGDPVGCPTPIADPTYIHDPSGFVYEVLEANRLEGVIATLETATSPTGPWEIWDADWFLQDNPLVTDVEGRYGWDVPEGWWRVRWEQDGYETQYSDPLEVLPPRFDVNADLRNLTPPSLSSTRATAGGTTIELGFDQLMDVDFATDETLEVLAPVGESWTVAAVDEQTSAGGDPVATTFAIDLGRTLAEGEQFTIAVDLVVRSASGIPIGASTTFDVTVQAAPASPQTITFAPLADVVFGVAPIAVSASASSGLTVSLATAGPCSIQASAIVVSGIGTCTVTASQDGNPAWLAATPVVRAFAVAPKPLTVTAHSAVNTVGDPVPSFGGTATGLVAPDTLGSLGGLVCASAAPRSGGVLTTVGSFAVTCSGLHAPNYTVSYVAGTHDVKPRAPVPPAPGPASARTVVPARVLETRIGPGLDTIDGRFEGVGRVAAGAVIEVDVSGRGGVPDGVDAVMLNVTAIRPEASGYLTVYPCDAPRPLASNVNYSAGQVIPNAVLAKVAADGTVCIFTWAATDLAVDVNGYVSS